MNKFLIIVNPVSGGGKALKKLSILKKYMEDHKFQYKIVYTKKTNDTTALAIKYYETDFNYYIICGGDGTINEVINGLPIKSNKVLMVLPLGTVNIFSKEFNIPKSINSAMDKLVNGKVVSLPVGIVNDSFRFLLMDSVGLDSFIVKHLPHNKSKFKVFFYFFYFVKAIFNYTYPKISIKINNNFFSGTYVIVSKCRYYAGFLKITPDISLLDKYFTICLLEKGGIFATVKFLLLVILGLNRKNKDCKYFTSNSLYIFGDNLYSQADGETSLRLPLEIRIIENAFKFLVPK